MTAVSEDSQSSHVSTAIAGVSDTFIVTVVATRMTRKKNDWLNARLRLMTLRTILKLNMWMWKDIRGNYTAPGLYIVRAALTIHTDTDLVFHLRILETKNMTSSATNRVDTSYISSSNKVCTNSPHLHLFWNSNSQSSEQIRKRSEL